MDTTNPMFLDLPSELQDLFHEFCTSELIMHRCWTNPVFFQISYIWTNISGHFENMWFRKTLKNTHRNSLHRTLLNNSPSLIWSCSGTKTMIGKVSKIRKYKCLIRENDVFSAINDVFWAQNMASTREK